MSDLRIAAQQALEALIGDQDLMVETAEKHWEYKTDLAIAALRAALAQEQAEPAQEPVAQAMQDAAVYGVGISRDGKRIDPASIYEQPAQEPDFHGFMSADGTQVDLCFTPSVPRSDGTYATAYYTHPPQRPPLTDAEMLDIIDDAMEGGSLLDLVRAIERKVRGEA